MPPSPSWHLRSSFLWRHQPLPSEIPESTSLVQWATGALPVSAWVRPGSAWSIQPGAMGNRGGVGVGAPGVGVGAPGVGAYDPSIKQPGAAGNVPVAATARRTVRRF